MHNKQTENEYFKELSSLLMKNIARLNGIGAKLVLEDVDCGSASNNRKLSHLIKCQSCLIKARDFILPFGDNDDDKNRISKSASKDY